MYRFPADLDLSSIVGKDLNLLSLGKYQMTVDFTESDIIMVISGKVTVTENNQVIAVWNEESGWSSLAFQKLLNAKVTNYSVPNDRCLKIEFEQGISLQIHDDSDQYEVMQIYFRDKTKPMIVV